MRISDWSSDVCSSDLGNVPWLQLHGGHGQRCLMPLLRLSRLEHAPDEQASQHKGKGEDRCKDGANVWEARFRALDQAHVGSGLCPRVRTEWMLAEQADLPHTTSTFVEVKDYLCLPRCRRRCPLAKWRAAAAFPFRRFISTRSRV